VTAPAAPQRLDSVPGIPRRLASLLYEGVLLFGVLMVTGLVYATATQQRHALQGTFGLQLFLFVVLGIYFVTCWSRGGQTLAMRTWRIRVVASDGKPLSPGRALARYVASWLWFLPALATVRLAGLGGAWPITLSLVIGILTYAALARLHPERQFPHDAVCGTRLVDCPPGTSKNG